MDSGATCHITPEVSDFIPGSLEDMDKHIEVMDGHHVTMKQKGQVQIKIYDNTGYPFIATLHNVLLALYLCDRLFLLIKLMNSGYNCLSHKGFFTVYFGKKDINTVTLPHSAQRKHDFFEEIKDISKTKILPARKKIALELLHRILYHRSTISLLSVDNVNFWEDIELRIDPDPFCTSCKISSMNKNAGYKNLLKPEALFKCISWI